MRWGSSEQAHFIKNMKRMSSVCFQVRHRHRCAIFVSDGYTTHAEAKLLLIGDSRAHRRSLWPVKKGKKTQTIFLSSKWFMLLLGCSCVYFEYIPSTFNELFVCTKIRRLKSNKTKPCNACKYLSQHVNQFQFRLIAEHTLRNDSLHDCDRKNETNH